MKKKDQKCIKAEQGPQAFGTYHIKRFLKHNLLVLYRKNYCFWNLNLYKPLIFIYLYHTKLTFGLKILNYVMIMKMMFMCTWEDFAKKYSNKTDWI